MCGVTGIIARQKITHVDLMRVEAMNGALAHRGPDGTGEYHDTHVALAMRRLSIIDLAGGWQPLYNEDRSLVLVANGEIYNFVELRRALTERGHDFGTGSDCETILHLYEEYGLDCVQHLRGMFAFALWDTNRKRLLLARDRMGEKPLYLYEQEGQLLFASEMKALLRSALVPFDLDPHAIDAYFHYGFVPEPATPIKGVRKLGAAHLLTVDIELWRVQEQCYWRMEDAPPLEGNPAELIRAELETISELVVRSDVPVGVALSGGLDSSAIAALAARKYPGKMHAFTVGYPDRPAVDERKDAQRLAKHLEMPFHEVELTTHDMVAFFPELTYWRDDPIADISGYGYYSVSRLAREHGVPVMLQGQAGDELFWGYPWMRQAVAESNQKAAFARWGQFGWLGYLSSEGPGHMGPRTIGRWVRNGFGIKLDRTRWERHARGPENQLVFYDLTPGFQQAVSAAQHIYGPALLDSRNGHSPSDTFTMPAPWSRTDVILTQLICQTYLRENGIAQGDRLAMASSVELRLPLVDHRLVETVIGLRKANPDHDLPPKIWLRNALRGVLPDWVFERPKRGFTPPVGAWNRALYDAYGPQLTDGFLVQQGFLLPKVTKEFDQQPFPLSFRALALEVWCRQFADLGASG